MPSLPLSAPLYYAAYLPSLPHLTFMAISRRHPRVLRAHKTYSAMQADKLPLELWQQVFAHACCDGGHTGLSLALVSHFFHNASHPVRFRSLAFRSLSSITKFLAYLDTSWPIHRPPLKIYHLLLSFADPLRDSGVPTYEVDDGANPEMWIRVRQQRELDKATWDQHFMVLVPALLARAAPHLETLAVLQSDGHALPLMVRAPTLPRLRELTLLMGIAVLLADRDRDLGEPGGSSSARADRSGLSTHPTPSPPLAPLALPPPELRGTLPGIQDASMSHHAATVTPTDAATDPQYPDAETRATGLPALERLHLVCGRHRDWTLHDALACLPGLAPRLSHLRISNTTYTHGRDRSIPHFLHHALAGAPPPATCGCDQRAHAAEGGEGGCGCGEKRRAAGFGGLAGDGRGCVPVAAMPELRRVIVHSVPPPAGGRCVKPYEDYRALVASVCAMSAACEAAGADMRVRWMESERARHREWEGIIEAQWVDRAGGGRGCW